MSAVFKCEVAGLDSWVTVRQGKDRANGPTYSRPQVVLVQRDRLPRLQHRRFLATWRRTAFETTIAAKQRGIAGRHKDVSVLQPLMLMKSDR